MRRRQPSRRHKTFPNGPVFLIARSFRIRPFPGLARNAPLDGVVNGLDECVNRIVFSTHIQNSWTSEQINLNRK